MLIVLTAPLPLIHTEGANVTNLTVTHLSEDLVEIHWTAPSPPPPRGYQLTLVWPNSTRAVETTLGTSVLKNLLLGSVYTVIVQSTSRHYYSPEVSLEVSMGGEG